MGDDHEDPDDRPDRPRRRDTAKRPVTRRGFLKTAGMGALAVAAASQVAGMSAAPANATDAPAASAADTDAVPGEETARVTLVVNGRRRRLLVEPRWSLLFVLREKLGLTGAKPGCERGECGACTVLIDDVPRYSCLTLAVEADGRRITTLEGLMDGEKLGPVQQAFAEKDGFQCGYCTPGQIMAAEGLLRANPSPTVDDIRRGTSGNLCRCGAYANIVASVQRAAELRRGGAAPGGAGGGGAGAGAAADRARGGAGGGR